MEFHDARTQTLLNKAVSDPALECAARAAIAAEKSALAHERSAAALERVAATLETVITDEQQRIEEDDAAYARAQRIADERRARLFALVAKIAPEVAELFPDASRARPYEPPESGPSAVQ